MTSTREPSNRNAMLRRLRARLRAESNDGLSLIQSLTDNTVCSVAVDREIPCVSVVWKRYVTSAQLRFVHERILGLLERYKITAIFGDDTALPTIHADDQRWIVEDWMPRAQAAGLKAGASKLPQSHFGKVAINAVQAVAPPGLALRAFERLEDARGWLREAVAG